MTPSISRRTFLAALGAAPLAAAGSWERRPFPDWTSAEVDRILTDSPWAKPLTVAFELEPPPTRLLSDFSDVGFPGRVGLPTGIPGVGWPGGGRQGSGSPGPGSGQGGGGGSSVRTEAYLTIRWSSALPVRQAVALDRWGRAGLDSPDAVAFLHGEESDYIVEAFGLPVIVVHKKVDQLENELVANAALLPKGRAPIRASSVHIPDYGQFLAITFRFPRDKSIDLDDGSVEFTATTAQFDFRKKFKLDPMVYGGRLEL